MGSEISTMFSGMSELVDNLRKNGIKMEDLKALEMFGRNGERHTKDYAHSVNSLEIWEIDERWKVALQKNFPHATIKIIDSIKTIYEDQPTKFSFIVVDSPMNIFDTTTKLAPSCCEHFEVLPKIDVVAENEFIVIFNVNPQPFNYEQSPKWKRRRENFYKTKETSNISLEFLDEFYQNFFKKMGFDILYFTRVKRVTPNPIETVYYFAFHLRKSNF